MVSSLLIRGHTESSFTYTEGGGCHVRHMVSSLLIRGHTEYSFTYTEGGGCHVRHTVSSLLEDTLYIASPTQRVVDAMLDTQ